MIKLEHSDITAVKHGLIVHQVNTQGAMGSGVALAIRNKWPEVYDKYIADYKAELLNLGCVSFVEVGENLYVANLAGQKYCGAYPELQKFGRYTSYDGLANGLEEVQRFAVNNFVEQVHFPMIGCGLGGGDWRIVESIIQGVFSTTPHIKLFNHSYP